jgi:hypothetical protein
MKNVLHGNMSKHRFQQAFSNKGLSTLYLYLQFFQNFDFTLNERGSIGVVSKSINESLNVIIQQNRKDGVTWLYTLEKNIPMQIHVNAKVKEKDGGW